VKWSQRVHKIENIRQKRIYHVIVEANRYCWMSRYLANWMSGIINTGNRDRGSYGETQLGQIKYIVNCAE